MPRWKQSRRAIVLASIGLVFELTALALDLFLHFPRNGTQHLPVSIALFVGACFILAAALISMLDRGRS